MGIWRSLPGFASRKSSKKPSRAAATANRLKRDCRLEQFEDRRLLAVLVSVIPNEGDILTNNDVRNVAPNELTFRFDQAIDPTTLGAITITRNVSGTFGDGDDIVYGGTGPNSVAFGFIGVNQTPNENEVVVRFAESLPDDQYRIFINGGPNGLKDTAGGTFNPIGGLTPVPLNFELALGAQVLSVVPQPITRAANGTLTQANDTIEIYFNEALNATSAQNVNLYQLIDTHVDTSPTGSTTDDTAIIPTSATYDAPIINGKQLYRVTLRFAAPLAPAAYRLRVGDDMLSVGSPNLPDPRTGAETEPSTVPPTPGSSTNSTFAGAQNVDAAGFGLFSPTVTTKIITGNISPKEYKLQFPGGIDEPGHRDVPVEEHLLSGADTVNGITTITYAFPRIYSTGPTRFNVITEFQKQRAREVFELYSHYLGVNFREVSVPAGSPDVYGQINVVTGEPGAVDANIPTGVGGVFGIAGQGISDGRNYAIMDQAEQQLTWGNSEYGGAWFQTAMHEIGHLLGLGDAYDLPALTIMAGGEDGKFGGGEPVFPGDHDIVHGQFLYRPEGNDIDLYKFTLNAAGHFSAQTFAERSNIPSQLDSVISLYRETAPGVRELISRNDDYYGEDSFLELDLAAGTYYLAVTSTGNDNFDPTIADSGLGGTTAGNYELRLNFNAAPTTSLRDADSMAGTVFDGDADGTPGGSYNFWFKVQNATNTIYVDKAYPSTFRVGTAGSITNPYATINSTTAIDAFDRAVSLTPAAGPLGVIIRVVGNGGTDNNPFTTNNNAPYLVGRANGQPNGTPLADGATLDLPKGVTMMIDAGAIFKLRAANINAGSTAVGIDLSGGAIQVLGTPQHNVFFTSYANDALGGDSNNNGAPVGTLPSGDWGGIVFRNDSDLEAAGVFLNYVNNADFSYGGGTVVVGSSSSVYTSIHMVEARPTVSFNTIHDGANAAISADPRSFEDSKFLSNVTGSQFTADYERIGPDVHGNHLRNNSINGLFVRIGTGNNLVTLDRPARFNDTDIVHVITEQLVLQGTPGGQLNNVSRLDARLAIDAGTIVKLQGARIEAQISTQLIAEGLGRNEVVFTSIRDDRYGAGGTFDTANDLVTLARPGDWGGIYFGPISHGSLDHVNIQYAGGRTSIEGGFDNFNPVEIQQADVRIANSLFANNANGLANGTRAGRLGNTASTIFVRGAQPVIVNNIIRDGNFSLQAPTNPALKTGAAISVNANALTDRVVADTGRSTGIIDVFPQYGANHGPLVRLNRLQNDSTNAMVVRGAILTAQSIWDDADIVHVLREEIQVPNFHTYGGLRLQSSSTESLVVKLQGANAGFTATGTALDIDDRIGGSVQIVGQPGGHPVIMTSINDDSVGAGVNVRGVPQNDTNDNGALTSPAPGDWRSVRIDKYSNDRNVAVVNELESSFKGTNAEGMPNELNGVPDTAQNIGKLAADEKSGDDVYRLGYQVHGSIALDDRHDVDVYSFNAKGNSEVWIDIDRTAYALDTVVELIDASGVVLVRSDNSEAERNTGLPVVNGVNARLMQRDAFSGQDLYTTNPRDAGFRVFLPGDPATDNLYYVRVRSGSTTINDIAAGQSQGTYQLELRLRELDEVPGSTVRYADIRFATSAIEVLGMPSHSPLLGETTERDESQPGLDNDLFDPATPGGVQDLGNLLASDRNTISVSGNLTSADDVDWYKFDIDYQLIQAILGANDAPKTWSTLFDIDYADGLSRPDTYLNVFDSAGNLIYVGRDSDIDDDQPRPTLGGDTENLDAGSFGKLDPFIGPAHLPEGNNRTYFVAVSSNAFLPQALNLLYQGSAANELLKLEPVTGVHRIAEDHIGQEGYITGRTQLGFSTVLPVTGPLLDISDAISVSTNVRPFQLSDVALYVSQAAGQNRLWTVDPNRSNSVETNVGPVGNNQNPMKDITIRSDGRMYGYQALQGTAGSAGQLVLLDSGDAVTNTGAIGSDQVPDTIINTQNVDAMAWRRNNVQNYDLFYTVSDPPFFGSVQGQTQSYLFEANPANGSVAMVQGQSYGERGLVLTGPNIVSRIATHATDPTMDIVDGMNFSVDDGVNGALIFEFEGGVELTTVAIDGTNVDQFDGTMMVDDDGDPMTPDISVPAPHFFSINGVVFEYDVHNPPSFDPGNQRVDISNPMTAAALATEIARAINASPLVPMGTPPIAVANRDRVTIRDTVNPSTSYFYSTDAPVLERVGPGGTTATGLQGGGTIPIYFDANSTQLQIATAIAQAITNPTDLFGTAFTFDATAASTGTSVNIGLTIGVTNQSTILRFIGDTGSPTPAGPGGAITGMAFVGGTLYGVSSNGGFFQIPTGPGQNDPDLGNFVIPTKLIPDDSLWLSSGQGLRFEGLTLGPQNLDGLNGSAPDGTGDLAQTLFAITGSGRLTAFDVFGSQQAVFDADRDTVLENTLSTGLNFGVTGLAFSNLDFNLWHPTTQRRNDPGHGINNPVDDSRSGNLLVGVNGRPTGGQGEGAASYYFGLENWIQSANKPNNYFEYGNINAQYGILDQEIHRDLASNPDIQLSDPTRTTANGSYNLPGGAHGSLITNPFSLSGYDYGDKPTLYFNYYLVTQDASGTNQSNTMRDSARVLVSTDGGNTWVEVATNNSARTQATIPISELPEVATPNSITNRTGLIDGRQGIQELFDTTDFSNEWRQARIDLGKFVGAADVRLRFDFATAGDIETAERTSNGFIQGDQTGNAGSAERGQDNQREGFYIDDIIVGFAEHGEIVTGSVADTGFFAVPQPTTIVPEEDLTGPYQLEIRRGTETAFTLNPRFSSILTPGSLHFDTNKRFSDSFAVGLNAATEDIVRIDDGVRAIDFEFDGDGTTDQTPDGVPNIGIPITGGETPDQLAELLRDAINNAPDFLVTASTSTSADSIANGATFTSDFVQLFDAAFVTASGGGAFQVINNSLGNSISPSRGDKNLQRQQGQILIEANSISDTLDVGILVDAGARDANGTPHPGAVRNLFNLNEDRLVPGVMVLNNLVVNSGQAGIRISGEPDAPDQPLAPVPFFRVVNNTVFGSANRTGTGIDVTDNASPTILNNLVSNLNIGIALDVSSMTSVLGQNMFNLNNTNNVNFNLDAGDIVTANTAANPNAEPVFVNAATRNFYPAAIRDANGNVIGSQAIDSSINSLPERDDLAAVTQPLGIPPSTIFAPELDLLGLQRVDEPDVDSPPGSGSDVFKDRGALDRADFDGPQAVLANPLDNVAPDTHASPNRVVLPPGNTLLNFTIQFIDPNGSGIDNSTVDTTKFVLTRNGVPLVEGTHYIFSYDPTNKLVRFIPIQGLWLPGSVFEITIVNNDSDPNKPGIKDLAQNLLAPNNAVGETRFTIVLPSSTLPVFAVNPPTIVAAEGNSGTVNKALFTVTLTGVGASDATINFATANGNNADPLKNATASQDYLAKSGTLTFEPGVTSQTVSVDIIGDIKDEDLEQFRLLLSSPVNATLDATMSVGTATINDDDDPTIEIRPASVIEGDTGTRNLVFNVVLSTPPALPVTVDYATASPAPSETTATPGVDYVATMGTLTIPANSTTGQITVTVNSDILHELGERLFVNLSNPTNAAIAVGQALGFINDDDSGKRPALSITGPQGGLLEGMAPGAIDFTLTLNKPSGLPITVQYSTIGVVNDSATAGSDYVGVNNAQVTFQPGETAKTVSIQVNNDTIDEKTEFFRVSVSAIPAHATRVTNNPSTPVNAIGAIIDNDGPTVTVTTIPGDEEGLQPVRFTINLSAPSPEELRVKADIVGVSATAGSDFTPVASQMLVFAPNETQKTISVPVLQDSADEADELIKLVMFNQTPFNATFPQSEVFGTIIDNEGPTVSLTGPTGNDTIEGNSGNKNFPFVVSLSAASVQPITVNYTTVADTATAGSDFQPVSGSVTFNPGETSKIINVPVFGDTTIEPNQPKEQFKLQITLADPALHRATLAGGAASLTATAAITDDDGPAVSVNDVTVAEGNGGITNVTFTVSLSFIGIEPVTANYTTVDFTGFAGSDYDARSGTLTFAPGERVKFVTVPVRGDQLAEPTESFRFVLSNISINAQGGKTVGTATIVTDDAIPAPTQTIGLFAAGDSVFFLKETNAAGPADRATGYGPPGNNWTPLAGDWNGDTIDTFGFYDPSRGLLLLKNSNTGGPADLVYNFGPAGVNWQPIVGDWNGDGIETIGLFDPVNRMFHLRNSHSSGGADLSFSFSAGSASVVALGGDWNGDNIDTVGLFDPTTATWHLKNSNTPGATADTVFQFGAANNGWIPVTGDFNGDRVDTIGFMEPVNSAFFLRNSNSAGNADQVFTFGPANLAPAQRWKPVFGNWNVPTASAQMLAADSVAASASAPLLSQAELENMTSGALARWAAAGLSSSQQNRLSQVDVRVADLPEGYLGLMAGDVIYIDQDAAGRGWFVDRTPGADEEFDGVDLLTVLSHEMGHVLGLDDLDAGHDHELMAESLSAGVRRLPTDSLLDDVFGGDDDWRNG